MAEKACPGRSDACNGEPWRDLHLLIKQFPFCSICVSCLSLSLLYVPVYRWCLQYQFNNSAHHTTTKVVSGWFYDNHLRYNKANLRDLIAATGLVILLKFDPIHRFFSPCDLEIWCMTLKNNRAPLLYYIKLCVSFQIHRWIQTKVTVRKRSIRVKIGDFLSCVTLKFDGWPWKTIEHLFYMTSSFVHHFIPIGEFKFQLQSGNAQFGQNWRFFEPCDLQILRMTLQNNRAPLLCYFKLCASFCTHSWI